MAGFKEERETIVFPQQRRRHFERLATRQHQFLEMAVEQSIVKAGEGIKRHFPLPFTDLSPRPSPKESVTW